MTFQSYINPMERKFQQSTYNKYLISGVLQFTVIFVQHHPQSKAGHYGAMAQISKHHSKQKGKCDDGVRSCSKEMAEVSNVITFFTPLELTMLDNCGRSCIKRF